MVNASLIIPARNEALRLPKLVNQIRSQELKKLKLLEIIVAVSPTTSDKTKEIAEDLGCVVVNGGYPDEGRNNGAKSASKKSKLFIFQDCDTEYQNRDFLEKAHEEFFERELDVAGTVQQPMKVGKTFKDKFVYPTIYGRTNKEMIRVQNSKFPYMQNLMIATREAHEKIGGFLPLTYGEDAKYAVDAVAKGLKFGIITSPGYILISPKRFEQQGVLKLLAKCAYYLAGRKIGHEFYRGKSKIDYFTEVPKNN